jgi:hypothetical protein
MAGTIGLFRPSCTSDLQLDPGDAVCLAYLVERAADSRAPGRDLLGRGRGHRGHDSESAWLRGAGAKSANGRLLSPPRATMCGVPEREARRRWAAREMRGTDQVCGQERLADMAKSIPARLSMCGRVRDLLKNANQ